MNRDQRTIVMVEDNPADVESVRRGLDRTEIPAELSVLNDGVEAYELLETGELLEGIRPDLILLDLNVPGLDGREFLRAFEEVSTGDRIPLVVLTTSRNRDDVEYAYENGANAYVVKPSEADQFLDFIESIFKYWFKTLDDQLSQGPQP